MAHHERDSLPSNDLSARDECAVPQDVAFPNSANIGPRLIRLNGMAPAVSAAEAGARRKLVSDPVEVNAVRASGRTSAGIPYQRSGVGPYLSGGNET